MRLTVTVKPGAIADEIISWTPKLGKAEVQVKASAEKNKANIAMLKLLKKHTKKQFFLSAGQKSRQKLIEISE